MKSKKTKAAILIGLSVTLFGVAGLFGFRQWSRMHTAITWKVSGSAVNFIRVGCYPILHDGDVLVQSEDDIQALVSLVNGKKFDYWGTLNHRNWLSGVRTGGYYETYSFCDSTGKELASFEYDDICGGYVLTQKDTIYKLADDSSQLKVYCEKLINKAKKGELVQAKKE